MLIFPPNSKTKIAFMRKSYRFLVASLIASLLSVFALAQQVQTITISGTVRNSSSKEVVPAVSVGVKGTNIGTYTKSNGEYSIKVGKLPVTLIFSSTSFESYELTVSDTLSKADAEIKPNYALGLEVVMAATRTPQ